MNYRNYLEKSGKYRAGYVKKKVEGMNRFLDWLDDENLTLEEITYREALSYVESLNKKKLKRNSIQKEVANVRAYFDYLKGENEVEKNVFDRIELKGKEREILYDLLKKNEMEEMYKNFPKTTEPERRNKVILGLFIHQGISSRDLANLEIRHVKLEEGWVIIEGCSKSNRRELSLSASQILDLNMYLELVRPNYGNSPNLIVNTKGEKKIQNILDDLRKRLKKEYDYFDNYKQLRASVITNWLRELNLREVQYRAGHRFVSSTEKYKLNDIEGLKEDIERYHPI